MTRLGKHIFGFGAGEGPAEAALGWVELGSEKCWEQCGRFLREEGIYEEVTATAIKRAPARQISRGDDGATPVEGRNGAADADESGCARPAAQSGE